MSFLEMIQAVADRTGMSRRQVRTVLKSFVETTSTTLEAGEKVVLPGFGVFFVQEMKPRTLFGGTRSIKKTKKIKFRMSRRA